LVAFDQGQAVMKHYGTARAQTAQCAVHIPENLFTQVEPVNKHQIKLPAVLLKEGIRGHGVRGLSGGVNPDLVLGRDGPQGLTASAANFQVRRIALLSHEAIHKLNAVHTPSRAA
jgi:hypothetical protein